MAVPICAHRSPAVCSAAPISCWPFEPSRVAAYCRDRPVMLEVVGPQLQIRGAPSRTWLTMVDPDRSVMRRDDSAAARAESIDRLSCWAVRTGSASQAASASAATARRAAARSTASGPGRRPAGVRRRLATASAGPDGRRTTYAAVTTSASSAQPRARRAHQSPTRMVAALWSYAVTWSSRSTSPRRRGTSYPPSDVT